MNETTVGAAGSSRGLLVLEERSLPFRVVAVITGVLFLAATSLIEVPMWPVPLTMQTYSVTLVGALYGWRLGATTVSAWLLLGAAGMPVLAGGGAGLHHFFGPTGGYLFGFVIAAAFVGWLYERGCNVSRLALALLAMLLGNAVCLGVGAAWLAVLIGPDQAIIHGVVPFILGGILKSMLGAATLKVAALTRNKAGGT